MTRVKSDIFCKALLRAAQSRGIMGAVVSTGSTDAGAVFITTFDPDKRLYSLWAPAPQAAMLEGDMVPAGGRYFERRKTGAPQSEIDEHLAGERRFDPDIWVIEMEAPDDQLTDLFDGFA